MFFYVPRPQIRLSRRALRAGIGILLLAVVASKTTIRAEAESHSTPSAAAPAFTMNSSIPAGFHHHVVAPEGRDFLRCRFLSPNDFVLADLPTEEIDFENSPRFMPLAVMIANYGPVVFTVSARPAFSDGAVSEWLEHLCETEGFHPAKVETVKIGRLSGVACDAEQVGDGITMRMRLVLLENGGRLFNLSAMAPTQLWSAAADKLEQMIASFEVAEDHGSQVALTPARESQPEPATLTPAAAAHALELATEENAAYSENHDTGEHQAKLTDAEWAELVLADEPASLDPEERINANLRNNGVGLVPNILSLDRKTKSARIGCGSLEAVVRIPFGWRAIDDGKRTLIFDGDRIQISVNQRQWNKTPAELAEAILAEYEREQVGLKSFVHEMDGITMLGLAGLQIDGEECAQAFMIRDLGRPGLVLVARATAKEEHLRAAANLAGDIMARIEPLETLAAR